MKENNFHFSDFREGINFVIEAQYGRILNKEIYFSNLTFKELLNRATKIKKGSWILKWRYGLKTTGKELIDIDI